MKKTTQAFSLVMAMGIVILLTLLAFLILEYIIPFGRNVKGIENSSKAYYQAQSGIEQALLFQSLSTTTTGDSHTHPFTTGPLAFNYDVVGNGSMLPPTGEGNSEYDDRLIDGDDFSWNTIAPGQPIQLEVGGGVINWSSAQFYFRTPNIGSNQDLQGDMRAIINWQLSSTTDLLSASGSWITADDINGSTSGLVAPAIGGRLGATLENGEISIVDFYDQDIDIASGDTSDCVSNNTKCTLKFSIVNSLILEPNGSFDAIPLPYLEWRFDFGSNEVPLRYAGLESEGKSYGFKKKLELKIPQQTIVEAFDFTVFQ